jgi:hypothetical protein
MLVARARRAAAWRQLTAHQHARRGLDADYRVAPNIAALVRAHADVEPANDGLFPGTSQTYRWIEP